LKRKLPFSTNEPRLLLVGVGTSTSSNMSEPLVLYRSILRLGRHQLRLTDQEFFRKLVRAEFDKYKGEKNAEEVAFQIEVCDDLFHTGPVIYLYG